MHNSANTCRCLSFYQFASYQCGALVMLALLNTNRLFQNMTYDCKNFCASSFDPSESDFNLLESQ